MPTDPTVPDEAAVEAAARAKIAACEYLLQVNHDMGGPFIPPTAIDWLGNGIAQRVVAAARPILDAQSPDLVSELATTRADLDKARREITALRAERDAVRRGEQG